MYSKTFKRILCFLLCPLLAVSFFACDSASSVSTPDVSEDSKATETSASDESSTSQEGEQPVVKHTVAYIPLDNRPVNKDRVEYLAKSMGVELLIPEESLYRTALDNMSPNPDGSTIGNREALLAWLKETDKTCDYFIISLDQMLSGGLVGSRWLDNTDLSFEYEIADTIIDLCKNNTVYLFDTVMRLASTVSYGGYQLEEYYMLREYGQAARKTLKGDDLTVENIVAGYRYGPNGNKITTRLPESALEKYHASRTRKLVLADYILRQAGEDLEFIYVGVDDSSPETTIQTNEINYLTGLMGDRGVLSAAADELGMCCLARMATDIYGKVEVNLTYYGPGKDQAADEFDIGTLGSNIDTHLVCLNVTETQKEGEGLQVLILTRGSSSADRVNLMNQAESNLQNNIPTVLLDVTGQPAGLSSMIFHQYDFNVAELLGYSSWNTAGNAMGIALSQGVARYAYLSAVEESTEEANQGFLQSMAFAYVKDAFYKAHGGSVNTAGDKNRTCSVPTIMERINQSTILTALSPYTEKKHATVKVSNFRYPWDRTFEMTFDITVS